jgi:hypothetical protein
VPVVNHEAGIQYVIPAGWKSEQDQGYAYMWAPDGSVRVAIFVSDAAHQEAMGAAIASEIRRVVDDAELDGEPAPRDVNGIKVMTVSGKGTVDGKSVRWRASRFEAERPVFVVAFADPAELEKHQAEIDRLVGSLKAA